MNLDLIDRATHHPEFESELNAGRHRAWRAKWRMLFRLLVLTGALWQVHSVWAVDPYISEFEKSPTVDVVSQQWLRQRNREAQERYRKVVAIPSGVGQDIQPAASDRSAVAAEAPLASTPESRERLLMVAVFVLV